MELKLASQNLLPSDLISECEILTIRWSLSLLLHEGSSLFKSFKTRSHASLSFLI